MSHMDLSSFRKVEDKCHCRIVVLTEVKPEFLIEEVNHQTLKHLKKLQKNLQ